MSLAALATFLGGTRSVSATDKTDKPVPVLTEVAYYDGSDWRLVETSSGAVQGPAGGSSPTARMKAELGGPKTFFLLAGTGSDLTLRTPRPLFRFNADPVTAAQVQLAQFEVVEGLRRTTVEIAKNISVFKKGSDLEVTKIAEGVYEAKPKKSLQPGEYALVTCADGPAADFTVVESGY
jgi:hypothetical protein